MSREHFTDYDEETTARCEKALLTLLGGLGPWRNRIYLAGGLAPRYLVGNFLAETRDDEEAARNRQDAFAVVQQFLRAFQESLSG